MNVARVLLLGLFAACTRASEPAHPSVSRPGLPAQVGQAPREAPPQPSGPLVFDLPQVDWKVLPNGVRVGAVENHGLPVVHVRVAVMGGRAIDGERIGLTALTTEILKAGGAGKWSGRELVAELDALGVRYDIGTSADAVEMMFSFDSTQTASALDVIAAILSRPRFDAVEYAKLKRRERERVADMAKTSGRWAARTVLNERIYGTRGAHPYAAPDMLESDVEKVTLDDCKEHWRTRFVAGAVTLLVAGDISPANALSMVQERFASLPKGSVERKTPPEPSPREPGVLTLVDRPGSTQSDLYVAALGPNRLAADWPRWAVLGEVLGGMSGRLFSDIREKQSLAYAAGGSVREDRWGPSVLVGYAATQSPKSARALAALRGHFQATRDSGPTALELATATRYLAEGAAVQLSTLSQVIGELGRADILGLPAGYLAKQRAQFLSTSAVDVSGVARTHVPAELMTVAVGDAALIAKHLVRFGPVRIVDPLRDFAEVKRLEQDSNAPWEPDAASPAP